MASKSTANQSPKPCIHCGAFGGTTEKHHPNCIVVYRPAADGPPVLQARMRQVQDTPAKFVAVGKTVMQGAEFVATARGHNMALRIANALNRYTPNERGF